MRAYLLAARVFDWGLAQQRRQPLLGAACLFQLGVAGGFRWGLWAWAALGVALGGAACFVAPKASVRRRAAVAATVLLCGWTDAAWDRAGREREAAQLLGDGARGTFVCRVGSEVAVTPLRGESAKYTFRAQRTWGVRGAGLCRFLPVEVNWYGNRRAAQSGAPQAGEVWRVSGKASVKRGRDGLLTATINTGEERSARVSEADLDAWLVRVDQARRQAARRVTIGIEDWGVVPSLNQAMMLGSRSEIPRDMRRVFANSGTIHVFAISGLNIALVAALLIVPVSALGLPRPYWGLGLAPLLIFYTVVSGSQPSAVRACLMAIIYYVGPLFGRRPNGLAALAATALLVYAYSPGLIYNIGCTLSFAVMGGLVVFCQPFSDAGRRLCRIHVLEQSASLYAQSGNWLGAARAKALAAVANALIGSVAVSLAAWLASLPLTAYYFARFTPGGFFANLVIAPCAFLVMVGGCLGLVASLVSDWAASCFNHAAGFFTVVMVRTAELTTAVPWANFRIARWEPWMVWAWFGVLALCAVGLSLRRPADGLAWLDGDGGR